MADLSKIPLEKTDACSCEPLRGPQGDVFGWAKMCPDHKAMLEEYHAEQYRALRRPRMCCKAGAESYPEPCAWHAPPPLPEWSVSTDQGESWQPVTFKHNLGNKTVRVAVGKPEPAPPRQSEWAQHMRSLLGKRVRVVLQREPKEVTREGTLIWFEDSGEFCLRGEDGHVGWGWPNLDTEAVPDG